MARYEIYCPRCRNLGDPRTCAQCRFVGCESCVEECEVYHQEDTDVAGSRTCRDAVGGHLMVLSEVIHQVDLTRMMLREASIDFSDDFVYCGIVYHPGEAIENAWKALHDIQVVLLIKKLKEDTDGQ